MKKAVLLLLLIVRTSLVVANTSDRLLSDLDRAIEQRADYELYKEQQIEQLKSLLQHCLSPEAQYKLLGQLFEHYLPYNADSAMFYTQKRLMLAQSLSAHHVSESNMNMAAVKNNTGMYDEALNILNNINYHQLSIQLRIYRYNLYRAIYGSLQDYAITQQEKQNYLSLTNRYRDSTLANAEPGSKDYIYALSDKKIADGQCNEAIELLSNYFETIEADNRDRAIVAYTLAQAWRCMGNEQQTLHYLTISATCDIKESVKEYISLWQLASTLYLRGDIDRAYNYLKLSLEDANDSKARLRTLKINEIYPVIEKAYQKNKKEQQQRMQYLIVVISIMALFLMLAIIQMRRQLFKLKRAKSEISEANIKLQQLNAELARYNQQMEQTNTALSENISIKEEYIGRYMDLCSHYINKMDQYRRSMYKRASSGKTEELIGDLKSSQYIKDELKDFYSNFDLSFLRLYPTFIDEFNALLTDDGKISVKPTELLNTELRVFALIRLGITDSEKIAKFLGYSITTIYNYRTKMRNKAAGNRNEFDTNVMKIGLVKKE